MDVGAGGGDADPDRDAYPGLYDNLLIVVGFVFDALIIYDAWTWT